MLNFTLPLLAYCFGSISSAIIVCRIMHLPDPRTSGSNNPGATNVLRIGGKKAAVITLIGDLLKGLVPMLIAKMLTDNAMVIALVGGAAFLGHLYPVFFGGKGGKGVATATGVFLGLSWSLTLVLLAIWLSMAVLFRYSSLAALSAATLAPFFVLWLLPGLSFFLLSLVIAVLLFWRHKENLSRLLSGLESKIGD
ncbi:glycerol-3-phosphate 1-O-acyltransferase PlsY [Candidatus Spongiihabitans sp.]|uniref:glycerol-3-phosphate 1-O-acyltransferase PlsY n=1 Tax=Candidatus Spongiihabitans sp. TaxID=3101308 RepID=UPI003C703ED5